MPRALLVAEKPSLERKCQAVYEKYKDQLPFECDFFALRGHILALKSPDEMDEALKKWTFETLPIFPEEHGGWKYKIPEEKKIGNFATCAERFADLNKKIKSGQYDFIINAGDPDQEGELLVRIPLMAIGCKLPIKRFWTNALADSDILNALQNLRDDLTDPMLVNLLAAAYARQHSDWLLGMNASRAATLQMGGKSIVAVGRCKTPMLDIICQRYEAIKNFKPKTVYGVKAQFQLGFDGQMVNIASQEDDKKKEDESEDDQKKGIIWFDTKEEAEECIGTLAKNGIVIDVKKNRKKTYADKLFKMSDLQVKAAKYGISAEEVMETVQSLYDAGYMSYPRTSCEYLSSSEDLPSLIRSVRCVPELASIVDGVTPADIERVRKMSKWINDEKIKEEGHTALVPTASVPNFSTLSQKQQTIYELVAKQFLAIFLSPLLQDKTTVITDISGKTFRSNGNVLIDAGFTKIFGTEFNDVPLPEINKGDNLAVEDFLINENTSTCPKDMTDSELIAICTAPAKYLVDPKYKALGERLRLGTEATRTGIIKELAERNQYIKFEKHGKSNVIIPTEIGLDIYHNLSSLRVSRVDVTGEWEVWLEDVRCGRLTYRDYEARMRTEIINVLNEIRNTTMKAIAGKNANGKWVAAELCECPKCKVGKIMSGEKGFYCSKYKEGCDYGFYRIICDSRLEDAEGIKLVNGETIPVTIKKGKTTWKQNLRFDPVEKKLMFVTTESVSDYKCPKCGNPLVLSGPQYKCTCGFVFWTIVGKEKKSLTDNQIASFFAKGTTGVIKGIKSSSGKKFDAELVLKADKSGSEFKFADRNDKKT